jgi:SAM-dependent methyltransferase
VSTEPGAGHSDSKLLEFGCGTGRYTFPLAKQYRFIVAVDFSQVALESIAGGVPGDNVALVRADLEHFAVAPRSFDGVLSTLTSNLPTAERRRRLYELAAEALKDTGTFVSGLHYYGLRARLKRVAKEGYYNEGGIYRYYMTCNEALRANDRETSESEEFSLGA